MFSYGLDLGLNSSCVASETNSYIKVMEIYGKTTVPSYVYYDKNKDCVFVGDVAKNTVGASKYSLLYDAKRYIGKKWYEINTNENNKYSFRLINKQSEINYEIVHNNKTIYVTPVDVTSHIIKYIDSIANVALSSQNLSEKKYNIAIGIPSSFTCKQRDATKKAAKQAGLKNIYLIPEPIAAVLGYLGEMVIINQDYYILVYELRRNYFNVSIVRYKKQEFTVVNEEQDDSIGGDVFTQCLVDYYIKHQQDNNILKNEKKMNNLKKACEDAKQQLLSSGETDIYIDDDDDGVYITSSLFEIFISSHVNKTIEFVSKVIRDSNLRKNDIDYCILVGASCQISNIKNKMNEYFKVLSTINPDEVVAKGCAHYAFNRNKYRIKYSIPRTLSFELRIKNLPLYSYGIDLGTTFSCAAFVQSGKIEMISPNTTTSSKSFPSCVTYSDDFTITVGHAASNMKRKKNYTFIYDAKRFIGLDYDDIDEDEIKYYPFKLVKKEQIPVYNVNFKDRIISVLPLDIESEILKYIHSYAVYRMFAIPKEIKVEDILVTICVPASFTDRQRESTIKAAEQAGLVNIQLIPEPVAAFLAFLEVNEIKKNNKDCKIMVYDFGGGTFDVTIINLDDDNIDILETEGDAHLGGEDITRKIEEYVINDIKEIYDIDVGKYDKYKMRVHEKCEEAKIFLSQEMEYNFDILVGEDYIEKFSRTKLNDICKSIFQRTIDVLDITLNKCKLKPDDIDYVVLVGGSSRIPIISDYIRNLFKRDIICKNINPDEAIATGAAIYARSLYSDDFSRFKIHKRYLSSKDDGMDIISEVMINRFSYYPCKNKRILHCKEGYRHIQIYESDEYNPKKRHMIDSFELNIYKECDIEIKFEVDEKGELTVSVKSEGIESCNRKYEI